MAAVRDELDDFWDISKLVPKKKNGSDIHSRFIVLIQRYTWFQSGTAHLLLQQAAATGGDGWHRASFAFPDRTAIANSADIRPLRDARRYLRSCRCRTARRADW